MKTKIRHLSNYLISVEPDLLLAQPNPSRTYECPNIGECLRVVPRPSYSLSKVLVFLIQTKLLGCQLSLQFFIKITVCPLLPSVHQLTINKVATFIGHFLIGSFSHFFLFFFFHVLNHANLQRNFFFSIGGEVPPLKVAIFWTY